MRFKSFCRGTRDGRFNELPEHEDPWPLLLALTTHKAIDLRPARAAGQAGRTWQQSRAGGGARKERPPCDLGLSQLMARSRILKPRFRRRGMP